MLPRYRAARWRGRGRYKGLHETDTDRTGAGITRLFPGICISATGIGTSSRSQTPCPDRAPLLRGGDDRTAAHAGLLRRYPGARGLHADAGRVLLLRALRVHPHICVSPSRPFARRALLRQPVRAHRAPVRRRATALRADPARMVLRDSVSSITPASGILTLSLLQAWVPIYRVQTALNRVSWSLSAEWFFYLCFPLLL